VVSSVRLEVAWLTSSPRPAASVERRRASVIENSKSRSSLERVLRRRQKASRERSFWWRPKNSYWRKVMRWILLSVKRPVIFFHMSCAVSPS
jgi:hypothetical protein